MTISRRSFLSGVTPLLAIAAAKPLSAAKQMVRASNDLREDVFRELIGSSFDVHDGSRKRGAVSLTDVISLDAAKNRTRHAFSLRFHQTKGIHLAQGTYRFKHAGREFELFVVPGPRSSTPMLTATINRA
jgi:hypothetical protein